MTINCKNIRNNFMYINEELEKQDIIFIQEHWLNEYEIHNLHQYINSYNHNAHLISSIDLNENKQGRPHRGIGWLINKKIKIIKNKEIKNTSERISILKLLDDSLIIRVYLHCNNNDISSYNQHLHAINQLRGIIQNEEKTSMGILILGYFDLDLQQETKNSINY
jgi:exonuclease III